MYLVYCGHGFSIACSDPHIYYADKQKLVPACSLVVLHHQ